MSLCMCFHVHLYEDVYVYACMYILTRDLGSRALSVVKLGIHKVININLYDYSRYILVCMWMNVCVYVCMYVYIL
jgi:L-rhamnose isomerase